MPAGPAAHRSVVILPVLAKPASAHEPGIAGGVSAAKLARVAANSAAVRRWKLQQACAVDAAQPGVARLVRAALSAVPSAHRAAVPAAKSGVVAKVRGGDNGENRARNSEEEKKGKRKKPREFAVIFRHKTTPFMD